MVGFPASLLTVAPSTSSVIRPSASLFSSSGDFARSLPGSLPPPSLVTNHALIQSRNSTRSRALPSRAHGQATPAQNWSLLEHRPGCPGRRTAVWLGSGALRAASVATRHWSSFQMPRTTVHCACGGYRCKAPTDVNLRRPVCHSDRLGASCRGVIKLHPHVPGKMPKTSLQGNVRSTAHALYPSRVPALCIVFNLGEFRLVGTARKQTE